VFAIVSWKPAAAYELWIYFNLMYSIPKSMPCTSYFFSTTRNSNESKRSESDSSSEKIYTKKNKLLVTQQYRKSQSLARFLAAQAKGLAFPSGVRPQRI
jgi:hypothetical protein